jgi:hypothetical protein
MVGEVGGVISLFVAGGAGGVVGSCWLLSLPHPDKKSKRIAIMIIDVFIAMLLKI